MQRAFGDARPVLGRGVWVDPSAQVIGDVTLGDDVSIWPLAVVRGDIHRITIGRASNIQDGSVLHVTHDGEFSPGGFPLKVGEEVTVGHRVVLHGCTIGSLCLIGMGAVVMDGAEIGDETLLAAGSVVAPGTRIQGGSLWRGVPARPVRGLNGEERRRLAYSARYYVELKRRYEHAS